MFEDKFKVLAAKGRHVPQVLCFATPNALASHRTRPFWDPKRAPVTLPERPKSVRILPVGMAESLVSLRKTDISSENDDFNRRNLQNSTLPNMTCHQNMASQRRMHEKMDNWGKSFAAELSHSKKHKRPCAK